MAAQSSIPLKALEGESLILPPLDAVPSYGTLLALFEQVGFQPKLVQQAARQIAIVWRRADLLNLSQPMPADSAVLRQFLTVVQEIASSSHANLP